MRLDIAAQTDCGRRKTNNEDFHGVYRDDTPGLKLFDEGALLCVADGLGGHEGGEIASKLAVSIVKDILNHPPPPPPDNGNGNGAADVGPLPLLRESIQRANESIYQTNRDSGFLKNKRPMGTTVLAAVVQPNEIFIGNVGDSRCYQLREYEIVNRTEDHSWVDEQVRLGLMSKAEAETDRRRNVVTRCVGTHAETSVDTYRWDIQPGDMLLLCTDGLVNMVPDKDIQDVFRTHGASGDIAQALVKLANENGGKDNITVIVAHVSPSFGRLVYQRARGFLKQNGFTLGWGLFLAAYGLFCGAIGYLLYPLIAGV